MGPVKLSFLRCATSFISVVLRSVVLATDSGWTSFFFLHAIYLFSFLPQHSFLAPPI